MTRLDNSVWGESMDAALSKREPNPKAERALRELHSELIDSLDLLFQMHIFNLGKLMELDPQFRRILDQVPVDRGNANTPYRDSIYALRARMLEHSLKGSIIAGEYNDLYPLAVNFFLKCMEYFIDPYKYREVRQALDISLDKFRPSSEYEGFSIERIRQADPLHFQELTREEYLFYEQILTILIVSFGDINIMDLQWGVEAIRNSAREFFADETEFMRNEEERFEVKNPLLYLRTGINDQKSELLGYSYYIDSPDDWGTIRKGHKDTDHTKEDVQVDAIVKSIINYYYGELDLFIESIRMVRPHITKTELEDLLTRIFSMLNSWLLNLDIKMFRAQLTKKKGVKSILRLEDINIQNSTPFVMRIRELKEKITEHLAP